MPDYMTPKKKRRKKKDKQTINKYMKNKNKKEKTLFTPRVNLRFQLSWSRRYGKSSVTRGTKSQQT